MSEEAPVAPAVAADAGDSVAGRASSAEPKPDAPESASRPDNEPEKAPEGDDKPAEESAASESAETKPADTTAPAESADANGKEDGDAAAAEAETIEANGTRTPASAKKASAKRKSTGGASARKRKSQQRVTHLDAKPGEYYLARLKSFPPWPAIICDEEMLPQSLLNTRPVTTKQADGTYKEPYADGGKRVYERTFPIMFLETNEFAWIPNTDLTPLDPESCKNVPEKGKGKTLLAAYRVAAENHDLQYFKDLLAEHQRAVQQEAEEREAKAAAKAAAKAQKEEKKKRRKSATAAEEAEDIEMDEADQEDHEKPKSARKRKKDAESDVEEEKPSKTPKTTTKLKLTTPKTPTETGKKAATSAKTGKQKKAGKEEEAAVETPKEPPKQIDPQEAKAKKEKEILFIRHKLQKGFLSRDQAPKEEEMAAMSNYIAKLETHTDLEVSIIRATKINKVLKAIIKLNSIPKDEEYQFRRRSIDILSKWKNLLESDVAAAGAEEAAKETKPKTNGVHKEEEGAEAEKADKADAQETEEKPVEKPEGKQEETPAKEEEKEAGESKDEPMPDAETEEKAQAPEPAKEEESPAADSEKPEKPTEEKPAEETTA